MPRLRIIGLDTPDGGQAARTSFRIVLWADVPSARQKFYANPALKSAWIDALPADNTALQNGSVAEKIVTLNPDGVRTMPQIQADATVEWNAWQAEVTATNKWQRYGTTWDGTTWTVTNGA